MAGKELWSWLVRSDAKTEIHMPPELNLMVSVSEYADALKAQAAANHLPVEMQVQDVEWDASGTQKSRILVRHADSRMNIVQFLTGIDRFGDFYYVEEKLYWDPPQLPEPPGRRTTNLPTKSSGWVWLVVLGGLSLIFAVWAATAGESDSAVCGGLGFLVGFGLLAIGASKNSKGEAVYQETMKQYQLTKAFEQAVDEWIKQIKAADYKSRTDDEFGRFHLAMRSTIRQTIQKLFVDRHAELRERKEKETSQQELAAELERRKTEGFR